MRHSKWLLLILLAIAQFMVVLDVVVVNVALPAIKAALHFSASSLPWIVTAYGLSFGGFLLVGGRAADLFGRRRVLATGMTGFMITSLLIGVSRSSSLVIALRALQGISAALMSPAALSIVLATFPDEKERSKALSIWSMIAIAGQAVGLMLGGLITQYVSWRWDFLINVPISLAVLFAIPRIVPDFSKTRDDDLDLLGAALVTSGLIVLAYAFSQASSWGWLSAPTMAMLAFAAALLVLFVRHESHTLRPLVSFSIFKNRNLLGANLIIAPLFAGVLANLFLTSQYIQNVMHYSPLKTGVSFVAIPVTFMSMASLLPRLMQKFGYRKLLMVGTAFVGLSMFWLSHLPTHGSYIRNLLPAFVLIALGMGINLVSLITAGTSGVAAGQSGLASGLISTSQQMGGALGLAILSGVATSSMKAAYKFASAPALVRGYDDAFTVASLFMVAAFLLTVFAIRLPRQHQTASSPLQMAPQTQTAEL